MRKAMIVILFLAFSAGCVSAFPEPEKIKETGTFAETEVQDYGNGVYFFPYYEKAFGYSLSEFLSRHPDLDLVTLAVATSSDGATKGYFVVFRSKKN